MALNVYKDGKKVGEVLTDDEAQWHSIGTLIRNIWLLSPIGFLTTISAFAAVAVRTEKVIDHPFIWGSLVILVITCMLRGNWAIILLAAPFAIEHFFPGYYWIGLLALWIGLMIYDGVLRDLAEKATAVANSPQTQAPQEIAPRVFSNPITENSHFSELFTLIEYKILLSGDNVAAKVRFSFTNPIDANIVQVDGTLGIITPTGEALLNVKFHMVENFPPNETCECLVETADIEADSPLGKRVLETRHPQIGCKFSRFVFADGSVYDVGANRGIPG